MIEKDPIAKISHQRVNSPHCPIFTLSRIRSLASCLVLSFLSATGMQQVLNHCATAWCVYLLCPEDEEERTNFLQFKDNDCPWCFLCAVSCLLQLGSEAKRGEMDVAGTSFQNNEEEE